MTTGTARDVMLQGMDAFAARLERKKELYALLTECATAQQHDSSVCSSGIQISEDIGVERVRAVRDRTARKIAKTVVVRDDSSIDKLKSYEPFCDFILLDSQVAGYVGGNGATSDWNLCKRMVQASDRPVYLAGGWNPDNLTEAIRLTEPHGVDVSTGVSTHSESFLRKDRKDPEKIKASVTLARSVVKHAVS